MQQIARRFRTWLRDVRITFLPDRKYMVGTILPALTKLKPRRVLFVGVQRYTFKYERQFSAAVSEFWTIDIASDTAEWGSTQHHVIGDIVSADKHFAPAFFDIVVLNGIFGHGVNTVADQDRAIAAIRAISTDRSYLLVGWNPGMSEDPLSLPAIQSQYIHGQVPGLPDRIDFRVSNHTYDFFTARHPAA
jgi:hypothetical protein